MILLQTVAEMTHRDDSIMPIRRLAWYCHLW